MFSKQSNCQYYAGRRAHEGRKKMMGGDNKDFKFNNTLLEKKEHKTKDSRFIHSFILRSMIILYIEWLLCIHVPVCTLEDFKQKK